jgi:hypothetical protein
LLQDTSRNNVLKVKTVTIIKITFNNNNLPTLFLFIEKKKAALKNQPFELLVLLTNIYTFIKIFLRYSQ